MFDSSDSLCCFCVICECWPGKVRLVDRLGVCVTFVETSEDKAAGTERF